MKRQYVIAHCPACGAEIAAYVKRIEAVHAEWTENIAVTVELFPVDHTCPDPTKDATP